MKAYWAAFLALALSGLINCSFERPPLGIGGMACATDGDCQSPQGVCDVGGLEVCVQCVPGTRTEACTPTTPVCNESYECAPCKVHSDCASDACLPDGSCLAENRLAYVVAGGTGANCTKDAPCGSINAALAATDPNVRSYIRVTGLIENTNVDLDNRVRTFLGTPGMTTLRGGQVGGQPSDSPIFTVRGRSKIAIQDIEFRDARRVGIRVDEGGTELTLQRSKIVNAGAEGLFISGGTATLVQAEVSTSGDATRYGIYVQDGQLIADRSVIAENRGGGIKVDTGRKAIVTNSFIVGNKVGGGISALQPTADSRFEFNTIVDNVGGNTALDAGGIICNTAAASARHNIIYRNTGGSNGMVQKLGVCNSTGSFELAAGPTDDTLKFKSDATTPKDYHLTTASPASVRDVPGLVCAGLKDFDGDDRPQGAACDLGADELKQ